MQFTQELLQTMITSIMATHANEIVCDECYRDIGRFIEEELDGHNAAEAMPLIRAHIDCCADCREEYEALLMAIQTIG